MSTRLLLEGDDLEQLLTRVRAEYGPEAVLVRAERVRTGGLGGFFAREHFELTIEVPEHGPLGSLTRNARGVLGAAPRATTPTAHVSGIDALLAAADAAELVREHPGELVPNRPAPVEPTPATPAQPQLSTGGQTFASILDSVRSMAGAIPMEGVIPVPAPTPGRVGDLLSGVSSIPTEEPDPVVAPSGFEPMSAPAVDATSSSVVLRPPGAGRAALLALGVPAALLAETGPGPVPLSDLLLALPRPPEPTMTPGDVVVVVGDAATVMATARQMATRLGLAENDVVLAGDLEAMPGHGRRLQTAAAARRYRERETAEDSVTVVAVGVGPVRVDQLRAAEVIEALQPDQSWAVVDARSKHGDCKRWLVTTGRSRRFDALAVTGIFATEEPGTVLDLGVAVGWIDGLPATRVAWAAVLSRHLGEDARWD
jgi:hypothetical protein